MFRPEGIFVNKIYVSMRVYVGVILANKIRFVHHYVVHVDAVVYIAQRIVYLL